MSYQEEERSRLRRQSTKQAIALAMQGRWREALAVNQGIIDIFPHDAEALNRLGRAHLELGEFAEAEAAYRRTTEVDPYNAIALKNLQRLSYLREAAGTADRHDRLEPQSFIEEVGKAGVVRLVDLAPPEVVARTAAGDRVELRIEGASLIVETGRGEYLGQVEAGHARRLIRLTEGGNRYSAAIVGSAENAVSVIIREVYQDPGQAGRLSFPSRGVPEAQPDIGERVIRWEGEQEAPVESGYTVVGVGEEAGTLVQDSGGSDDEGNEEE